MSSTDGIRLLALDIDGTILDSAGRVPPENVEAIARAIAAGIEVVLATGRRYDFAKPIFTQLPGPLTLILSNGAIVKTTDGTTLLRHLLPRDTARAVLAAFPEHRSTAALLFDRPREGQIVYEQVDWDHPRHHVFFRANREFISEIAPIEEALTEDPLQLMFTGGCEPMRRLYDRLCGPRERLATTVTDDTWEDPAAEAGEGRQPSGTGRQGDPVVLPHGEFSVALTEYVHRDFSLVDIIRAGCSKGAALAAWAERRAVPAEAVMAIGDNLNDLQMLEFAGHPVVMGNAVPELRARGWRETASNDEAGVAAAIDAILRARRRVKA